jgi:hypothetical protein
MSKREQIGLPGMERATVAPAPSAYTIVRCACGTRVVVAAGCAPACPSCRQIVSSALIGGAS